MSRTPSLTRLCGLALAGTLFVAAAGVSFDAAAQGRHGGQGAYGHRGGGGGHWRGHHHGGYGWGGLALGIGLGALILSRPWEPPVVVERPTYIYADPPPALAPPPQYLADARPVPARPDPIIYPSQGQSADRIEADRQACNRWATTQPSAMADASVFHRATLACLEGRGYTVK